MIPYGMQDITESDIEAVIAVLKSDFLTQGPAVPKFEHAVANHVGVQYTIAVNSATSALHLACLALELGPEDMLWTSPITFVASANCALYCGAGIDFIDIDPLTYNLSPQALRKKLAQARKNGNLPKIIVPVHLCGQPCAMEEIFSLSKEYGFRIIEDASHAIGGKYENSSYIGNGQFSDITIFSFHPVKIITTAEGGMALTNQADLAERMMLLRSHGITRDPKKIASPSGAWYYEQIALGYNYRMTELQAALGTSQMHRLNSYVAQRHEIAERYNQHLTDLPVTLPWQAPGTYSSRHLYPIRLQLDKIDKTHAQVFDMLRTAGIGVNVHYIPVHIQPYYQALGFKRGQFPQAERYYEEAISLPIFPALSIEQQSYIIDTLKKALIT